MIFVQYHDIEEFGGDDVAYFLLLILSNVLPCMSLSNWSNVIKCLSSTDGGSYIRSRLIRTHSFTRFVNSDLFCAIKSTASLLTISPEKHTCEYSNTKRINFKICQMWLSFEFHDGNASVVCNRPVDGSINGWRISDWNVTIWNWNFGWVFNYKGNQTDRTGVSSSSGKFLANVIVNRNIPSQYVPPRTKITPNQTVRHKTIF